MTYDNRSVREHMTPAPHTIDAELSVADAWERMRTLGVRHLPVIERGQIVAMLSEREVGWVCEMARCDPSAMPVADVATPSPCIVAPGTPLHDAVRLMAERRADSCAVVDDDRIVGILTTTDAMHLLAALLSARSGIHVCRLRPSEVRARILAEHQVLRSIYVEVEDLIGRVQEGERDADGSLRERCRELYQTLLGHIELENTILAPALRQTDGFGPVRADELLREHERQRAVLFEALASLDDGAALKLVRTVQPLIVSLRIDMAHEEQALLNPDLLKDDLVAVEASTG